MSAATKQTPDGLGIMAAIDHFFMPLSESGSARAVGAGLRSPLCSCSSDDVADEELRILRRNVLEEESSTSDWMSGESSAAEMRPAAPAGVLPPHRNRSAHPPQRAACYDAKLLQQDAITTSQLFLFTGGLQMCKSGTNL